MKRTYDSTVARMAGNIAGGIVSAYIQGPDGYFGANTENKFIAEQSVALARAIVAEVERTEAHAEMTKSS